MLAAPPGRAAAARMLAPETTHCRAIPAASPPNFSSSSPSDAPTALKHAYRPDVPQIVACFRFTKLACVGSYESISAGLTA